MATLEITVPDALVTPLLSALAWKYPDIDVTGLTAVGKGRRYLREFLRDAFVDYAVHQGILSANTAFIAAQQAARDAARTGVEGIG